MRILITNDDGINAPGLEVLHAIATDLAGADGEVWTVAPAFEQSGVGHAISYTHPMMLAKLAERRYAAEGSPADCVMAGLHEVLRDARPDLVLSGVNRGNNSAENALYSGTLGGAMEAALQGLPAMALSQYLGPRNFQADNPFEAAAVHARASSASCSTRPRIPRTAPITGCSTTSISRPCPPTRSTARASSRRAFAATPISGSSRTCRPRGASSCGSRAATSTARPRRTPMPRSTSTATSRSRRCAPT